MPCEETEQVSGVCSMGGREKGYSNTYDMYAHGMCACAVVLVSCRCMITECAVVLQQLQAFFV